MKSFGVDYYPEHWSQERWEIDAQMMKEAHINLVRLAEFSWSRIEKIEGKYDFTWLDEAIDTFAKYGIVVVLGTPTATPPKWLMDKYPDIYMEDEKGIVRGFGSRRHYCYNSSIYRDYSKRIVTEFAKRYGHHDNVKAWQIDNEFTCGDNMYCYCEKCRKAFIVWLKNKYGSLDDLNQAWGTVFWSQTYTDWSQIITPKYSAAAMFTNNGHNPGFLLDYSRFASDSIIDYCEIQSSVLRANSDKIITHNVVMELYDYYKIAPHIDIATFDNYPETPWGDFLGAHRTDQAASLDLERSIKDGPFWVIEQQSGPAGWDTLGNSPKPGQIRLWTYQAMAHGAETVVYFRWRACLFGTEQYWYGVLDHDGIPRRRYKEIQTTGAEFTKIAAINAESTYNNDVLMLRSFDQQWSHSYQSHNINFDYKRLFKDFYRGFYFNNINVDINNEDADFSKYKIVVAPFFNLMTPALQKKFENYVHNGGILVITYRSGTKNWDNSMTDQTLPGYFNHLAGIEVEEFDSLNNRTVNINGVFGNATASIWADIIKPIKAKTLSTYTNEYYRGKTAISLNEFGQGKCYYIGCDLDSEAMNRLISYISSQASVDSVLPNLPANVEAVKKYYNSDSEIYYLLNFNDHEVCVELPFAHVNLLNDDNYEDRVVLKPYDVALLKKT